ncbi:MAG: valine--tRNA ligase [Bacteroidetes bacterium]|nr:MAG: valine--tRNA ligase [Bacteroidota bacterium]
MKEIPKTYDPSAVEDKWYTYWHEHGFFKSVPDEREPYTIVIPPPNVTGVLHMGHMLNNTIQDVLIRRARMLGKNACWVPGTDHASIATEAKVVAMLKDQGINKSDLTRDEFLRHAWEWKEKYGGIILDQLKKLGASCDWSRTRFTMEDELSDAVISVFIDLYNKGYIYRGVRMVNWDPQGKTALSDEEVIYKEVNSRLFTVRYPLVDASVAEQLKNGKAEVKIEEDTWYVTAGTNTFKGNEFIKIATVRPETILGDTGVCVHPDDERYKNLKGKFAVIPMVNRPAPVVFDKYIDMEFGTGALKVTPAHDINDYNIGQKFGLEVIDTIADDGKMSPAAKFYIGEDRFVVRKKIVKDLELSGHLVNTEDYKNKVGYSERTDAVIEPKLSLQWFLKMDEVSKPALDNVLNGEIKLIPDKFINTYRHWMENVHDWCISRQLWWGQQIPAWYAPDGSFVVCKTAEEAADLFKAKYPDKKVELSAIKQDEDVLDTWFSSWLWPISVFDGFKDPNNKDINYYYPTNDLITAPEILFFWVARMIIAGYEYRGEKPFTNVYLTGIVRDKQGRKMSKSLGNSPEPLELIERYSADGVRVGMLLSSPAGNDLLFDESLCEQGRNFANKVWNAFRLVKGWQTDAALKQTDECKAAVKWFEARFNEQLDVINDHYSKYRISDALMASYKLVWDDFCSWYLEMVKPEFVDGKSLPTNKKTQKATIRFFENILKILHPFMPFISEELWHTLSDRGMSDCIIITSWPESKKADSIVLEEFNLASEIISQVRNFRTLKNISPKEKLQLYIRSENEFNNSFKGVVIKLANLTSVEQIADKPSNSFGFIAANREFFVPVSAGFDLKSELDRLKKELDYNRGFLKSVQSKLANERFVSNAKAEVVENEKKKQADAEAKIRAIEAQIEELKS